MTDPGKSNTSGSYANSTLVPTKIDVDEIISNYRMRKGNNIVSNTRKGYQGSLTERSHDDKKSFMEKTKEGINLGINKNQLTMMNFMKKGNGMPKTI